MKDYENKRQLSVIFTSNYPDIVEDYFRMATISLRKSAGTPDYGVSSQNAAGTLRILIKITKNSVICELFNILM